MVETRRVAFVKSFKPAALHSSTTTTPATVVPESFHTRRGRAAMSTRSGQHRRRRTRRALNGDESAPAQFGALWLCTAIGAPGFEPVSSSPLRRVAAAGAAHVSFRRSLTARLY